MTTPKLSGKRSSKQSNNLEEILKSQSDAWLKHLKGSVTRSSRRTRNKKEEGIN